LPGWLKSPLYAEFAIAAFILGVAVLAALGFERYVRGRWASAVVLVTAADLILVGSGRPMNTAPFEPYTRNSHEVFEGSRVTLEGVRTIVEKSTPPDRIDILDDSWVWANGAPMLRVPTANGNDPLALARIMQVRLMFCKGDYWVRYYMVSSPDSPVLDLLNVRYLIAWEKLPFKLPKVASLPGHDLYENRDALPRFFLVSRVKRANNLNDALAEMKRPEFDPRREAIVEGATTALADASDLPPVRVVHYAPERVVLETAASTAAFLVSSETDYPGWKATIDGIGRPLILTNVAFRGLEVPAGSHRIEMRFRPAILGWAALLSAVAMLLAAVALK
jgi:hypothetical protein